MISTNSIAQTTSTAGGTAYININCEMLDVNIYANLRNYMDVARKKYKCNTYDECLELSYQTSLYSNFKSPIKLLDPDRCNCKSDEVKKLKELYSFSIFKIVEKKCYNVVQEKINLNKIRLILDNYGL